MLRKMCITCEVEKELYNGNIKHNELIVHGRALNHASEQQLLQDLKAHAATLKEYADFANKKNC